MFSVYSWFVDCYLREFDTCYITPFSLCRPIHGLIFLFKWVQDDEPTGSVVQDARLDKIFFAKQVKTLVFSEPTLWVRVMILRSK
jgi:hypothetical protein